MGNVESKAKEPPVLPKLDLGLKLEDLSLNTTTALNEIARKYEREEREAQAQAQEEQRSRPAPPSSPAPQKVADHRKDSKHPSSAGSASHGHAQEPERELSMEEEQARETEQLQDDEPVAKMGAEVGPVWQKLERIMQTYS